jgi:hypothetical protein
MDDRTVMDWLHKDDVEEINIMPAKRIYLEDFNSSIWHIRECFWIWREIMYREKSTNDQRIQAWQYVKAYAKILKDKKQWDHDHGIPAEHGWANLTPNTPRWIGYYMKHPEEQAVMHSFRQWWERRTGKKYAEAN